VAVDNAEMNEDWTKTRSWDLYLGGKPVDTLKELLYIFGLQDSPLEVQQAKIRHFTELPSYLPAPQNLKDEIAIFVGGEILKGDVLGHDFHGNQHTGGIDGGGSDSNSGGEARQSDTGRNQVSADRYKVSDGSSETPASPSKFIGQSAADFTRAGGTVKSVKTAEFHKLQSELEQQAAKNGVDLNAKSPDPDKDPEAYNTWQGYRMMNLALDPQQVRQCQDNYEGDVRILVARDSGGTLAGAAMVQNGGYIHYIGSTHESDGAGTALLAQVVSHASEAGKGVAFEPLESAVKFWETAGFKPKTEGSDTYVMRSADAKQVAEELKGMKVQKGDLPGHDFHGNQYSDVQASGDGWVLVPRGGKGGDAPKPRAPKAAKPVIQPTVAVKPSAAARALEPLEPPPTPHKIEPRGGFVALTSTDIVKKLGDKEVLGGVQNNGFQRVLLADGTIGTLKTGVSDDDMRREMVAVTVAKALDLPTVESVPITENRVAGTWSLLMPWIEQDPDTVPREITRGLRSMTDARTTLRDINPPEFDRAELLHALTGNPDDHMGNYMTTKDPVTDEIHIIPIDNAIRGGAYSFETRDAVEKLGLSTAEIQRMDAGIDSILQTRAYWCGQEAQRDLMEIHDTWKSILPDMLATASQR